MFIDILEKSADTVGIVGVVLILIAYYLLNVEKMSAVDMSYQLLNFIGAWLILFSLYFHWNTASVVIEIAWVLISLIGIYRAAKPKKSNEFSLNNKSKTTNNF